MFLRKRASFDVTAGWDVPAGWPAGCVVDLTEFTFCGATIGTPIRQLIGSVPPSERLDRKGGAFHYPTDGFYFVEHEDRLHAIVALVTPGDMELRRTFTTRTYEAFTGRWRVAGRSCTLAPDTTPAQVRRLLGEPYHTWRDPQHLDLVMFYERPGAELQVAWTGDGSLSTIEITAPELDSAEGRALYGCAPP